MWMTKMAPTPNDSLRTFEGDRCWFLCVVMCTHKAIPMPVAAWTGGARERGYWLGIQCVRSRKRDSLVARMGRRSAVDCTEVVLPGFGRLPGCRCAVGIL